MQRQAAMQAQQGPQTIQPMTTPPQVTTQGTLPALSQGVLPVVPTSSEPVPSTASNKAYYARP